MDILLLKIISAFLIFLIAIVAGYIPFHKRIRSAHHHHEFPIGEALACGIFLGAGLIHMLGNAAHSFNLLGYQYPYAFLLTGATFLLMLWLEHLGQEFQEKKYNSNTMLAILATVMLSIHSFLAGAALGLTVNLSVMTMILLAILAHKWASGFALAVQINQSSFRISKGISIYFIFAVMTPLGILFGTLIAHSVAHYQLIEPIFSALAAGTFLYLGTLHGLKRAVMIDRCCDLKNFSFVIAGFLLMALVAVWT